MKKGLTKRQWNWLNRREIKEGELYMFPRFGFNIYSSDSYIDSEYININPFTRSLDHESFIAKEKRNGFVRGNYYHKPLTQDFYLEERELSYRDRIEFLLLLGLCYIPFFVYNLFKSKKKL